MGLFESLKNGLSKTRTSLVRGLDEIVFGEKIMSPETLDDLEEILITSDLGPAFAEELIGDMKERASRKELADAALLKNLLKAKMLHILESSDRPWEIPRDRLHTMMVVGVNGTGKTTTIGKMAARFVKEDRSVMIAAADTFRAAAIEQLEVWTRRAGAAFLKQSMGADPAAVAFDAIQSATARNINIMIVDTAGRLHTKTNLMDELKKIKRVMGKELPGAPHETLLVLDATTGQNALAQARLFNQEIGVTALALTKLDGTAKGGIIVRIAQELKLPIRFIGIGESAEDLRPFDSEEFVNALFTEA